MKKTYIVPELEIINMESWDDIVTASGDTGVDEGDSPIEGYSFDPDENPVYFQ